ncbi:molybdopterin-dependent oxidoreductase [Isoptericola hypogeus]|uniref:Molybdopterin-dependent oxidoreductase n=1 Tax=Isoptericola hypogeus TaxID=300179 RepID=A0ABN2JXB4_9MICO
MTGTVAPEETAGEVGRARLRKEDPRLLTGQTTWTDNVALPGMLYCAILRSPMAHARITRVDVSAAKDLPGVVDAFTGADLAGSWSTLPTAWAVSDDLATPPHLPLATDKVRYVGDGVAVVVAESRYAAADALEAIDVDYDPLPAVVDMAAAQADGAPLVHDDVPANRCFTYREDWGDYEATKQGAGVVTVTRRYVNQRVIPNAMEPRSVVASYVPATDELTLWTATQVPHFVRIFLALNTGWPEQKIRVIAPDVGGGFGSKLDVYAEEIIVPVLARRLGRPVKWTESRSEGYLATIHGRDLVQEAELTMTPDGDVLGLKVELTADMGAYLQLLTPSIPLLGRYMYPGIYRFGTHSFSCQGIFTTKTPTDAYRGAGRPEATYVIERLMDDAAAEIGMEPLEFRRRNWITDFPYTTVVGLEYDSGDYEAATAKAQEIFGYDALRAEQASRVERGDAVRLGIGISTYTEMCGLAPSRWLGRTGYVAGGWEAASVRILPTGHAEVVVGTSPHGQAHVTTFAQVASDALGIPFDDIDVLHGDTATAPIGLDTYGSRSLAVGGVAIMKAAGKVVDKARRVAAHLLEANPDDVEHVAGTFRVKGQPGTEKTIQELAFAAFAAHDLPEGLEPVLAADAVHDPDVFSYPHGTHLCAVEVDTETGFVTIRKYAAVDDVGTVVNPTVVEGQVHGGVAQGVAQALYEEAVYDADGNLTTGTMVDYLVPAAPDLPPWDVGRTETPSTTNPLGVKGVGETGTIASTPAVVNAVLDALRPLGVTGIDMPCSPERVWRAIQAARTGGAR